MLNKALEKMLTVANASNYNDDYFNETLQKIETLKKPSSLLKMEHLNSETKSHKD